MEKPGLISKVISYFRTSEPACPISPSDAELDAEREHSEKMQDLLASIQERRKLIESKMGEVRQLLESEDENGKPAA